MKLINPNSVYLTSIQNINWNVDSKAIAKAVELTKGVDDLQQKAKILWECMIRNNSYDYKKLATIFTGYIPVIDQILDAQDFNKVYEIMWLF